jgi:hypothetical protein
VKVEQLARLVPGGASSLGRLTAGAPAMRAMTGDYCGLGQRRDLVRIAFVRPEDSRWPERVN